MRRIVIVIAAAALLGACERETRRYQELPAAANRDTGVRLTVLQPGAPQQHETVQSPYQNNAWGMAQGKRLFTSYNCVGCHGANGGGAIGPALKDEKWIYGSHPDQIYSTISQGRPDGMPSFGGHIPADQIWMLVAYVQSMGGATPKDAAPSRNDDQMSAVPESRAGYTPPVQTGHR